MKRMMIGLLFATLASNALAYYNPGQGRWLSRDPIDEPGFTLATTGQQPAPATDEEPEARPNRNPTKPHEPNLYVFVLNDPQNRIDALGLLTFQGCSPDQQQQIQNQWNSFCQQVKSPAFKCCLKHFNIPQRLAAMCDRADTKIVCHASNTGTCQDTCGWTLPLGRTIHLCPLGLSQDPGCGPIGCTLLHEMTHLAGHWREKWADRVENCLQGCPQRPTH